jgi:hypothetical protein
VISRRQIIVDAFANKGERKSHAVFSLLGSEDLDGKSTAGFSVRRPCGICGVGKWRGRKLYVRLCLRG